jgi:polyphenol oxidase
MNPPHGAGQTSGPVSLGRTNTRVRETGSMFEERAVDGIRVLSDPGARAHGVGIAFSDRRGGISSPPFDDLNLALRVGDGRAPVEENRRRVAAAAGFELEALALARQVHGATAIEVGPGQTGVVGEADVLFTRSRGVVIGILTADCAPVVVVGDDGVAVAHAGWRGVVAGAVDRGLEVVGRARAAWIGPAIHSCCYQVGPEVVTAFEARGLPVEGRDRVDPAGAAAHVLARAGVETIVSDYCTHHMGRYFSYRRDGVTGRQGAFAWIEP